MGDEVTPTWSFPRKRESMFDKVKMGPRWSLPRQVVSRGGDDEICVIHILTVRLNRIGKRSARTVVRVVARWTVRCGLRPYHTRRNFQRA